MGRRLTRIRRRLGQPLDFRHMDLLEDFLAQPHARDAFLLRVVMGRPWSLSVEDEAPLTIIPVLSGEDGSLRTDRARTDSRPVKSSWCALPRPTP